MNYKCYQVSPFCAYGNLEILYCALPYHIQMHNAAAILTAPAEQKGIAGSFMGRLFTQLAVQLS